MHKRPKHIRIYDNGGKTFDRFTVVYMDEPERKGYWTKDIEKRDVWIAPTFNSLGMSTDPFNPQGFAQHGAAQPGTHLGKRIKWEQLPEDNQRCVIQDNAK